MSLKKALQSSLFFVLFASIGGGIGYFHFPSAPLAGTVLSKPTKEISVAVLPKEKKRSGFDATPLTEREWQNYKEARSALLRQVVVLNLPTEYVEAEPPLPQISWQIPLFDHPEWIVVHRNGRNIEASVDPEQLAAYIEKEIQPAIRPAEHVRILALPQENSRAMVEGESMKDGWNLQSAIVAGFTAKHVANGLFSITIPIQKESGAIRNETAVPMNEFTLLSRGRSNFAGSAGNRIFNLKKAFSEHVHGSLIAPGASFSFVEILDGPVEVSTGWKEALGIFLGEELRSTPGGGICQASTTVYRAALLAGLPIEEQRNHSLYVTYYTQHGEGLDATIFPGEQDLIFRNNTPGYILILTRTEGTEAIVEFYGTPDGREVTLEGPYRFHDAPEEFKEELRQEKKVGLARNDIGWRRRITRADGSTETNILLSRYLDTIPLYTKKDGMIVSE